MAGSFSNLIRIQIQINKSSILCLFQHYPRVCVGVCVCVCVHSSALFAVDVFINFKFNVINVSGLV